MVVAVDPFEHFLYLGVFLSILLVLISFSEQPALPELSAGTTLQLRNWRHKRQLACALPSSKRE